MYSKYIEFSKQVKPADRKTDTFLLINKSNGTSLGSIFWYGGFRKYVFSPADNLIFDEGCLKDIASFLSSLMLDRKLLKQQL